MRILIAHEAPGGGGGVESYLAAIMPALIARGHELAFFHHNPRSDQGPTRLGHPGIPTASVADDGLDEAVTRMRAWRPDVCFSHNMRQLVVEERLMSLAPVVKMMHGYFGTCIGGQKAHAFPGVQTCAREFGAPCLALYLPRRCGQLRPLVMIEQFGWASRQRRMFDRYAHVVVASEHMAREYARHGIGADRLSTAPLFPTMSNGGSPRQAPPDPTVVFVGRMTRLKGGDVLLRAIAIANRVLATSVRVEFGGEGPEQTHWRELAQMVGVAATFRGWVTGAERTALVRSASIVAVPSLWPEPFGLVGLEAAVHGVPAVAFDVGGIREWLHDGVNGRLVRERASAEALGATIAAMFAATGEVLRLGEGAVRIASTLTVDAHLDILERVFSRAAGTTAVSADRVAGDHVPRTFHVLTGEYPPHAGGVGDYTHLLAHGLAERGCAVHVWSPAVVTSEERGVHLHRLPDAFGAASRQMLEDALTSTPGCVLLQYVPNAVGARGANLPFCLWLLRLRRRHADIRVMFHEPYFYFSWRNPLGNVLAVLQRAMAAVLLRASGVAYVSTASWVPYLRPWNSSDTTMVVSPVPSTIAAGAAAPDIARWRARLMGGATDAVVVGHFGTFGDHVAVEVEPVMKVLLYTHATARFVCMGRGSEAFVAELSTRHPSLARRLDATGAIASGELAAALRACDVVVQPYPDGVTTRRTSVMAALANEVPTVSTDGALTEPVWHETGAVALAPASNAREIGRAVVALLRDPAARAAQAAAGRRTYDERFALDLTLDRLLSTSPVRP